MQGQGGSSNSFRGNFYFNGDQHNVVPNASSVHDGQHTSMRWMDQSSSSVETRNHLNFRQFLGDDFWLSPPGNQPDTGQRFEEGHFLENISISPGSGTNSHVISSNHRLSSIGSSFSPGQASSGPHLWRNLDLNTVDDQGNGIDTSQNNGPVLSLDLFGTRAAPGDQVPVSGGSSSSSSSPVMIYSGIAGYVLEENICREGLPADGRRRLLCKRRAPEITPTQVTSGASSSSSAQQAARNSELPISLDNAMISSLNAGSSSTNFCLNSSTSTSSGFVSALPTPSNLQQISNGGGQIDDFQRNIRTRRSVVGQQNPTSTNMWTWNSSNATLQVQSAGQSAVFSAFARFQNTSSAVPAPVSLTPPMQLQPILQVPNSLQAPAPQPSQWNGINLREELGQEENLRNHRRNMMIPLTNMQANLNSANGNANNFLGNNIASSSRSQLGSGMHLPSSSTSSPQLNMVDQYAQRLQHFVNQGQGNYCPIHSGAPPAVRDMNVSVRGGNARPAQVPFRLGSRAERQATHHSQVSPTVPSQTATQRRNRLLSEVRNALGLVRRGGGLRLEDVMVIDRSFLYGVPVVPAATHDDMRLDVDNMSYEELLDLEEQIGNVCTGLSDEAIVANLRRRKYQSIAIEPPAETESCCICQEDYADGEELGKLDCGHDFHFNCIKQWLVQKNSCPICKKTALAI